MKESQDRWDVPDCVNEELKVFRQQFRFVLGRGRTPKPWQKTLPDLGTRSRKNLVVEEGASSPEKVPLRGKTKVDFSQPWQSVTTLRINPSLT